MKTYHLEGMGVLGSIMGLNLLARGIPFTWWDSDEAVCAWKASGGAIFPTKPGSRDNYCLGVWRSWLNDLPNVADNITEAITWYCTKAPPHGAKYKEHNNVDGVLRRGPDEVTSLYLDVPEFVRRTRDTLSGLRSDEPVKGSQRIVAHGFSHRRKAYLWGWTAAVRLDVDERVLEASYPFRPAFYLRKGLYTMAYAAPVGALEKVWLVGSSMIAQMKPKELDVLGKLGKWGQVVEELTGGLVRLEEGMRLQNGWRPIGTVKDDVSVTKEKDGVYLPALGHSGVRHSPAVWDELAKVIGV